MRDEKASNSIMCFLVVAVVILASATVRPVVAALAPDDCIDFGDLGLDSAYVVPGGFTTAGTTVTTSAFQFSNLNWTTAGWAAVRNANASGGTGKDLQVNNVTLNFDFGRPVEDLRLFFGEYGGNVNLTINGAFNNLDDFDELDQQMVGGTLVEVGISPTGLGIMVITGTINSFSIGGQELWIDDICESAEPSGCIEFEDLPYPQTYEYGQFLVDSGVGMWLDEFFWLPSGSTTGGTCPVAVSQASGGTGQDVFPSNLNLFFGLPETLAEITLLYEDYGGNVNLVVNDDLANVGNFTALHNTMVGGAVVTLQPATGTAGQLTVTGSIESFAIGGQETYIDHVCYVPVALWSNGFETGNTTPWTMTVGGP